ISPGYCWPFQMSWSQVDIQLPAHVRPTAITVQHPLKKCSALRDISSTPRHFTVSVKICASWSKGRAGRGRHAGPPAVFHGPGLMGFFAMFSLQNKLPRAFQFIRLVIESNWGKAGYTWIYQVQVHG
ncbi:SUN5 protein, partial [Burhinus bistriatus]|nr:SUN5 protein [Burhinus bistriatus]